MRRWVVLVVQIEIFSDIACPWCFVGKRRFERALEQFRASHDEDVVVVYRSFELSPDTPVDFTGSSVDFLVQHKRMPVAQVEQMLAQMTELAAGEGLAYDFDTVQHTNTRRAHELLHHAKALGVQAALKERLLTAYFEQGRNVGDVEELVDLGADVGLDRDETREALTTGRYAGAVQADIDQAVDYGIGGVPFYVIDGRMGISGAQSSETFLAALEKVTRP